MSCISPFAFFGDSATMSKLDSASMMASTSCVGTRYSGAIFFTRSAIERGAAISRSTGAARGAVATARGRGGAGSRMQSGTSVLGPPTVLSMRRACSMPCSAAAWKKNAASESLRSTPRPLVYIQPRLNCDSVSPSRAALQYNATARAPSRSTPLPCS